MTTIYTNGYQQPRMVAGKEDRLGVTLYSGVGMTDEKTDILIDIEFAEDLAIEILSTIAKHRRLGFARGRE